MQVRSLFIIFVTSINLILYDMKRILLTVLVAIGVSLIAPQTAKAQSQINNGYEIEVIYNKTDKTTTIILYKDGVEVGRVTNPAQ